MELYVGGLAQGKTAYVQRKYEGRKMVMLEADAFTGADFPKGSELTLERVLAEEREKPEVVVLKAFHVAVKCQLWKQVPEAEELYSERMPEAEEPDLERESEMDPFSNAQAELGTWLGALTEQIVQLEEAGCTVAVISDEVGNGVVPMDAKERMYRECVGRCLIELAKEAKSVERVICGLGQKIK